MVRLAAGSLTDPLRPTALERHWTIALLGIFALSLALRLLYQIRLAHSLLDGRMAADSLIYWNWSSFLLDRGWMGQNAFFLGPLYPYLLTVLRKLSLTRPDILTAQAVGGSITVVLLADAARRVASPRAAFAIGLFLAGYQMMVFLDGQILMESLLLTLEALTLWLLVRLDWASPQTRLLIGVGLVLGLQAQGRVIAAALILPLGIVVWLASRNLPMTLRSIAIVLAGVLVLAVPTALRHAALVHEFIPFTYSTGYNYYVGNHAAASGSFVPITDAADFSASSERASDGGSGGDGRAFLRRTEGVALGCTESSNVWMARAMAFATNHPMRETELLLRKLAMMFNRQEYAQVSNIEIHEQVVGPIGFPFLGTFAILALLAAAGIAYAQRTGFGRYCLGHVTVVALCFASIFVTDRYRIHLLPPLTILAAFGVEAWWRAARARSSRVLALSAASAVAAVVVLLPLPGYSVVRRAWDLHTELGAAWLERDTPSAAIREFRQAILLDESGALDSGASKAGLEARSAAYAMYGGALGLTGRNDEAIRVLTRADSLTPRVLRIETELAANYAEAGREAEAAAVIQRAGLSPEAGAEALLLHARALDRAGRRDRLEPLLRTAAHLTPSNELAWVGLTRLQIGRGGWSDAEETLREAESGGVRREVIIAHRAWLAEASDHPEDADRLLASLPPGAASDATLQDAIQLARTEGRSSSP